MTHAQPDPRAATAAAFADQAAQVAGRLKHGTHDAVQALALVSIAHSLAVLAERHED